MKRFPGHRNPPTPPSPQKLFEITEEEIEEIVQDIAQDDEYGEWGRECAREGIRMVLSKLKGDE